MKRLFPLILLIALTLAGCTGNETGQLTSIERFSAEDFAGKKISARSGSVFDEIILEHIPGAEPVYFNNIVDAVEALKNGRIDAVMEDDAALISHEYGQSNVLNLKW